MNEIINNFVNALPFEMHLVDPIVGKYSACGPGTKHADRIKKYRETNDPSHIYKNELDKACFKHDSGYHKFKDLEHRIPYDKVLANDSLKIGQSDVDGYQKTYAALIHKFFKKKTGGDVKILNKFYYDPKTGFSSIKELSRRTNLNKKVVSDWLKQQETYTKHKSIKRKFETRRVLTAGIDSQWQADLVDMRAFSKVNNNTNYILCIIDVFSKYAWAVPIKRKTGSEITAAFKKIFKQGRKPLKLQTDKGSEFISKETQKLFFDENITWFTTENETKAQIVERFNRTLKDKMYKYFTAKDTKKWVSILSDLMKNYNSSFHRSIKMTPEQASIKQNEGVVRNNLYPLKIYELKKAKFKVGDKVRISKKKGPFTRGYTPNFTKEVFTISKVLKTNPVTYKITDNKEEIIGSFYPEEFSIQN